MGLNAIEFKLENPCKKELEASVKGGAGSGRRSHFDAQVRL